MIMKKEQYLLIVLFLSVLSVLLTNYLFKQKFGISLIEILSIGNKQAYEIYFDFWQQNLILAPIVLLFLYIWFCPLYPLMDFLFFLIVFFGIFWVGSNGFYFVVSRKISPNALKDNETK